MRCSSTIAFRESVKQRWIGFSNEQHWDNFTVVAEMSGDSS